MKEFQIITTVLTTFGPTLCWWALPTLLTMPLTVEAAETLKKQDQKNVGVTAHSFTSTKYYWNSTKMKTKEGYGDVIYTHLYISICFIRKRSFNLHGITLLTVIKKAVPLREAKQGCYLHGLTTISTKTCGHFTSFQVFKK